VATIFTGDEDLEDLSHEDFLELVNLDIRGIAPESLSNQLRDDDYAVEWYDALCSIKRKIEHTIVRKRADLATKLGIDYDYHRVEFLLWRGKALDFLYNVERVLAEAKRLLESDPL